ncbi:MAG: thiol-activated cytolysin family protein [Candidatus Thiodiazotropha sp. (ex Monitilora ramsayi)]|nr:thiol-activated cytolysin family protein [Candidatus Thiodiazotropha sp. (ex Monitilora ramsayi)]
MKRILHAAFTAILSSIVIGNAPPVLAADKGSGVSSGLTLNPIDEHLLAYKPWSDLTRKQRDDTKKIGGKHQESEGKYVCDVQDYDLTKTPKEVVLFDANSAALWPGALWQGGPYIKYQIEQLPLQPRASLTLTSDLPISDPSVVVESPSAASMAKAIETLRGRATSEGKPIGAKAIYNAREAYSVEQFSLDLGLSAEFASQKAKAALEWQQNAETRTIAAFFVQQMFTVSVPPPTTPSAFFDNLTLSQITDQEQLGRMGAENPPLYVESVTYGRLLYFTFTSTATHTDMKAALDYAYRGGADIDVKTKAHYEKILNSSQVRVVPYGGPWQNAAKLINSAKLSDYFDEKDAPLSTAVPISYRLNTLARGKSAAVAETTNYSERDCHLASAPVVKKNGRFHLQYAGDGRYVSIAEWMRPGDSFTKRPYPTLQQRAITMQFRGNGDDLKHGSQIRFATLEKKAQGRKLERMFEPGAWTSKSRVFYDEPQRSSKQDWVILKSCIVKKKKCDSKIRYGDAIHIRSVVKSGNYLCNEHKSRYLHTDKATCTWVLKQP